MTKEEAINKLAHIIFDAAKGGSIPFNVDGKLWAMSIARAKINEFLSPSSYTAELPMLNLDEAAEEYAPDFSDSIASKAAVNAVRDAFKAGAQWQKQQNEEVLNSNEKDVKMTFKVGYDMGYIKL